MIEFQSKPGVAFYIAEIQFFALLKVRFPKNYSYASNDKSPENS